MSLLRHWLVSLVLVESYARGASRCCWVKQLQPSAFSTASWTRSLRGQGLKLGPRNAALFKILSPPVPQHDSTWSSLRIAGLGSFGLDKFIIGLNILNQAKDSLAANGYDTEALHQWVRDDIWKKLVQTVQTVQTFSVSSTKCFWSFIYL